MPHTAFVCPDPHQHDAYGTTEIPIAACLNCSKTRLLRSCDYNYPLLKLMVEELDERVSPTRLMQCPRQVALKRAHPYVVNPKGAYARVRGTIFHAGLETIAGTTAHHELELQREIDGVVISGRADIVDAQLGLITDWKTTAYIRNDHTPHPRHVAQLSVYGWLARARDYECPYGELMYLDMSKPKRHVVELWREARVEAWIRERLPALQAAYQDILGPAIPRDHEDAWLCNYCPVSVICRDLERRGE